VDETPIDNTPVRTLSLVDADPGDVTDYEAPAVQELDDAYEALDLAEQASEVEEPSLADILEMLYLGISELVDAANDLDARVSTLEKRPTFASSLKNVRP
jgi:hypothetical protein